MTKSAAIVGAVNAVLAGLLAFGVDLTEAQTVAIVGIVNAVLVLFAALRDPAVPFGPVQYPVEPVKTLDGEQVKRRAF